MQFTTALFASFLLFCLQALGQTVIRTPYLQSLGPNSVILTWKTDVKAISNVRINEIGTNNPSFDMKENILKGSHSLEIKNLKENTWYAYKLLKEDGSMLLEAETMKFKTAPKLKSKQAILIWAMGDFGDLSKPSYVINQKAVQEAYKNSQKSETDLWLWLGDMAYCCGLEDQYQKGVFDFYDPKFLNSVPIFPVPGNHEYYATSTAQKDGIMPYFDIFSFPTNGELGGLASKNKVYYAFNYGNIHFVALDSYGLQDGRRLSDTLSTQFNWLKKDLEINQQDWTIVFFHHPPYTSLTHVSDAEKELKDIRENLTPLFDKFKVDMVLSGHTHAYERTKFIKNHRFGSGTFNETEHLVQEGNGNYLTGQKPYFKSDEGIIYNVVGSSGKINWNGSTYNFPAMAYTNKDLGGSLSIKIEDNRLDAKWIASDNTIKDAYTIFKNVNKNVEQNVEWGSKFSLSASWPGEYKWSDGSKSREVSIEAKKDTVLIVKDPLGFLSDTFSIKVTPQPVLSTLIKNSKACQGAEIQVDVKLENAQASNQKFILELFQNNTLIESKSVAKFPYNYTIPTTLSGEANIKVKAESQNFLLKPASIEIKEKARVKIANPGLVGYDSEVKIELEVISGEFPISVKINESLTHSLIQKNTIVNLETGKVYNYKITSVSNSCGDGLFDSSVVQIERPLGEFSQKNIRIFPNPSDGFVNVELNRGFYIIQVFSMDGKSKLKKEGIFEKLILDTKDFTPGPYILLIENEKMEKISNKLIIK